VRWRIFISICAEFPQESDSERILEMGLHFIIIIISICIEHHNTEASEALCLKGYVSFDEVMIKSQVYCFSRHSVHNMTNYKENSDFQKDSKCE